MPDELDIIQERILLDQESLERKARLAAAPVPTEPRDCARCGDEIPLERLKLVPATRVCIHCAREAERQDVQARGRHRA